MESMTMPSMRSPTWNFLASQVDTRKRPSHTAPKSMKTPSRLSLVTTPATSVSTDKSSSLLFLSPLLPLREPREPIERELLPLPLVPRPRGGCCCASCGWGCACGCCCCNCAASTDAPFHCCAEPCFGGVPPRRSAPRPGAGRREEGTGCTGGVGCRPTKAGLPSASCGSSNDSVSSPAFKSMASTRIPCTSSPFLNSRTSSSGTSRRPVVGGWITSTKTSQRPTALTNPSTRSPTAMSFKVRREPTGAGRPLAFGSAACRSAWCLLWGV
mmetsp:Transcript_72728/g.204979  ORF Transcript_72728/g.204979 Transcript_72728/m.204979 type:complete len:270 (+) Transcript_72728:262-1071(+)